MELDLLLASFVLNFESRLIALGAVMLLTVDGYSIACVDFVTLT